MVTKVSQDPYAITIYKLGDTYYGARSNEFEMIPSPQFVFNPPNAALNLFSIDLCLSAEQKRRIVPIIQQEMPNLQALKKNTSLKRDP